MQKEQEQQKHEEQLLIAGAAQAAKSGNLDGILESIRRGRNPQDEKKVVDSLVQGMSERGVENLENYVQTALSDGRNVTNTNSKEFALVAAVLVGSQVKNKTEITDTSLELKRISENPELPPEVRAIAKETKEQVEYAQFKKTDLIFQEIKKQKLEKSSEPRHSFKSV